MSDIAQYVAPGRCLCCGSRKLQWSPQQIVDACKAWTSTHGRTPAAMDWANATPEYPSRTTVLYVFGRWNNMLRAAELYGRSYGGHNWSKDDIANAMLDELGRTGKWPTWHGWHHADPSRGRPTSKTVTKMFGSWRAAKLYAGWDPEAHLRRVPPTRCAGCGTELDNYTDDCDTCWHRRRGRSRSETAAACRLASVEPSCDGAAPDRGGALQQEREAA